MQAPAKPARKKLSPRLGPERRISRWEHEVVLEKVQHRLDDNPSAMVVRRQTVEHPFGTMKCWIGATHFLTRELPKVATADVGMHRSRAKMPRP